MLVTLVAKVKSKSVPAKTVQEYVKVNQPPVQAWKGPEGSRSVRLPDFKTIGT